MKHVLWVRSRKLVWSQHATYENRDQGMSVGMALLRDAPDWNPSPPVRLMLEGERPPEETVRPRLS